VVWPRSQYCFLVIADRDDQIRAVPRAFEPAHRRGGQTHEDRGVIGIFRPDLDAGLLRILNRHVKESGITRLFICA
jgi:hypothetical protein